MSKARHRRQYRARRKDKQLIPDLIAEVRSRVNRGLLPSHAVETTREWLSRDYTAQEIFGFLGVAK